MAAFSVHANSNPKTRPSIPFLLDVQSDLLSSLETRVVVPLYQMEAAQPIVRLTPVLGFQGQAYLAMVPELAGVSRRELGLPVGELSSSRPEVLAAIDLLLTGF